MNGSKIKVCQVVHGIVGGGSEQVVLNYGAKMNELFEFDLVYQYEPNQQILERFEKAGFNCIQIPEKTKHPLKHVMAMYRLFKKGHYNVVHSHLDWYMNSYVCFLAILAGIPKRIAHHHQAYQSKNILIKFIQILLRLPNKIFATHWLACGNAAAISGWGQNAVSRGKVFILPNAIDPERFKFSEEKRKEIRSKLGITEDTICIGHVGRFYPEKNHRFIIDFFSQMITKNQVFKLLLVGCGPLEKDIKKLVFEKGLNKSVFFAGLQKDTFPYYCAMDVLVLPSIREAFPMTLVEAQYNGLKCVVSSAVPPEVKISDGVISLPITYVNNWVDNLVEIGKKNHERQIHINSNKYDINDCFLNLQNIYTNIPSVH